MKRISQVQIYISTHDKVTGTFINIDSHQKGENLLRRSATSGGLRKAGNWFFLILFFGVFSLFCIENIVDAREDSQIRLKRNTSTTYISKQLKLIKILSNKDERTPRNLSHHADLIKEYSIYARTSISIAKHIITRRRKQSLNQILYSLYNPSKSRVLHTSGSSTTLGRQTIKKGGDKCQGMTVERQRFTQLTFSVRLRFYSIRGCIFRYNFQVKAPV